MRGDQGLEEGEGWVFPFRCLGGWRRFPRPPISVQQGAHPFPTLGSPGPPFFRLSLTSELPHTPEVRHGDTPHLGRLGPGDSTPTPTPTRLTRAGVLPGRGGGCTPGLPGKAPYRARACGCPGLGDPRVASVRHRDDARGAAPAHTLAAGRSSALTCLTLQGRGKIAVRAAPGSPPRPGGPHEAGDGLMREPGWSLTA